MKERIVAKEEGKLSEIILQNIPTISQGKIRTLIAGKEVKVNGEKVTRDILIEKRDIIEVYVPEKFHEDNIDKIEIVFADDNVMIVNKPIHMEVVPQMENLLNTKYKLKAVHRLDKNTSGLVIFSRNDRSHEVLLEAFKQRDIDKYYLARVKGTPKKSHDVLQAFLYKDEMQKRSVIANKLKAGFMPITTEYTVLGHDEMTSLLEVKLITGKMHQIRAHLAHIGHPIVGDEKYGDKDLNKLLGKKIQQLAAVRLKFNNLVGELEYLNGKTIDLSVKL